MPGLSQLLFHHRFFFFFQAEDGIRDTSVTGVQTCALPIYLGRRPVRGGPPAMIPFSVLDLAPIIAGGDASLALRNSLDLARHAEDWGYRRFWLAEHHSMSGIRSEERRVGKRGRSRWSSVRK